MHLRIEYYVYSAHERAKKIYSVTQERPHIIKDLKDDIKDLKDDIKKEKLYKNEENIYIYTMCIRHRANQRFEGYILCRDKESMGQGGTTFYASIGHPINHYMDVTVAMSEVAFTRSLPQPPPPSIDHSIYQKSNQKKKTEGLHLTTKAGISLAVLGIAALVAGAILAFCTAGSALLILGLSTKIFGDILMMAGGALLVGGIALGGIAKCARPF